MISLLHHNRIAIPPVRRDIFASVSQVGAGHDPSLTVDPDRPALGDLPEDGEQALRTISGGPA